MNAATRSLHRFCLSGVVFAIPVLLVLCSYFVTDPFRVLRDYADISKGSIVPLNKDHVSTSIYERNHGSQGYNAFLLGSSRTLAYRFKDWRVHLGPDAVPFAFDADKESLWGMHHKLRYLAEKGASIRDALIIIDPLVTFAPLANSTGHLFIKDPRTSGESRFTFQKTFLEAYLADLFFVKYIDHSLFGVTRPYMKGMLDLDGNNIVDPITAERSMPVEHRIQKDPDSFYAERAELFFQRDTTVQSHYPRMITKDHLMYLMEMRSMLDAQGTCYHIVISPLYDQKAIHPMDLKALELVFGRHNVHDHSGINSITRNERNYIETSHYREHVGRWIMDRIYGTGDKDGPMSGH
ncbi:MAG: hypothetical protein R2815_05630 [Flavobacteriales bacterium]